MSPGFEKRRFRRSSATKTQPRLSVNNSEVTLVDLSSGGLRIELMHTLTVGETVQVSGEIEGSGGRIPVAGPCLICWCAEVRHGLYHAGLSFKNGSDVPRGAAGMMLGNGIDYYEALQVNRRADTGTIRRVFHWMAQRYHSDNPETGNQELFRQVVQARDVLCDSARRAAYDIQLALHDHTRLQLFEIWERSRNVQGEVLKRQAILRLLYNQRLTGRDRPGIVLRDFENLMGCPREHLEFSFWVLRQNKVVTCGDNACYEITDRGVAAVQAEEIGSQPPADYPARAARGNLVN